MGKKHKTEIRSAKRGQNERKGVHEWHPYYAGYSENFVDDVLNYMGATEASIVLDPWIGSGTTAIVCQRRGIKSLGNEINPVMVIFTKAKSLNILEFDITSILISIINTVAKNDGLLEDYYDNQELLQFLDIYYWERLNKLRFAIDKVCRELEKSKDKELVDCLLAFFYAALFRSLRTVGNFKRGKNPTWITKENYSNSNNKINILGIYEKFVISMFNDLRNIYSKNSLLKAPLPEVYLGDSRKLTLKRNSVDFIITSPPYLTRIDYAIATKPELLFLGYKEKSKFDLIRRATMGAPVISDKSLKKNNNWGESCMSFLEKVEKHETKAATSYYLPIFLQYFRDAYESLSEIKRVLKPKGKACLVVQSSYFKDVEAKLGDIYAEIGDKLGLSASIIKREEIRQHLAHVNTKSSQYVKNKIYYEDAVLLEKR
ncbi:DNA methyltransferase [Bacillus siamensis]|uniref:DNA methyltransferase n=1 Tax=Bacillus siamensis TaxID=659243 RepID=UPI00222ED01D|nr:DNA methyltransferase [Bacillus siamensis]UZD74844.1 hypothetical protein OM992_03895 [Bacillus siamensis]